MIRLYFYRREKTLRGVHFRMRPVMSSEVLEEAAKVAREAKYDVGVETAVVTGRPLAAQVNVRAMASIVQAMMVGGGSVLEDGK